MFRITLKILREEKGLSQEKFANAIGLTQSAVGNWESGNREPNFETMKKIADFFGVSVDYLLGRADAPDPAISDTVTDEDIKFALFNDGDIDDESFDEVKQFAQFVKDRKRKNESK